MTGQTLQARTCPAGGGDDVIMVRDATRDPVVFGAGRDPADADRRDVLRGCELRGRR